MGGDGSSPDKSPGGGGNTLGSKNVPTMKTSGYDPNAVGGTYGKQPEATPPPTQKPDGGLAARLRIIQEQKQTKPAA